MTQKNHGDAHQSKRQKTNDDGKSAPKNIILNAFFDEFTWSSSNQFLEK